MTVLDNVMTACHIHMGQKLIDAVLRTPKFVKDEKKHRDYCFELLEIFDLARFSDEGGTSLPYGSQRRLEIVRALATRPQLLLLDEPAAGMNPSEQEDLMHLIKQIRDRFGLTILLVEHNMKVVMGVCERIQVVDYGKSIALGLPRRLRTILRLLKPIWGTEELGLSYFDLSTLYLCSACGSYGDSKDRSTKIKALSSKFSTHNAYAIKRFS